jgi:uncharacterized membrane protein YgaE (UPF0421/DUF939 family)
MSKIKTIPKIEDLELARDKIRSDMSNINFYLDKVRADRARLNQMLNYYNDNAYYLKKHVGVINIDQYRKLKDSIARCSFFLKNANNDIDQFEKTLDKNSKQLSKIIEDIEHLTAYHARKVLQFPLKEIENAKQRRDKKENRNGTGFHLLSEYGELAGEVHEEASERSVERKDSPGSSDNS